MNQQFPSVLIAEDMPDNVRLLAEILSMRQCKVSVARHGKAALLTAQDTSPDIILNGIWH
jgi:CheY-like chemotaxis protein